MVRLKGFDAPEIKGFADTDPFRVQATASHSNAANQQIEKPAKLPQPIAIIPTGLAANPANRGKRAGGWTGDLRDARIHDPRAESRAPPGLLLTGGGECIGTARLGILTILTIAALHGRPTPTVEERRAWVLAVLIFGSTARQGFAGIANQMGAGLGIDTGETNKRGLTMATLRAVNGSLSRMVVRRYGTRRGAIAIGTALPLGVGALFGGGANYVAVRRLVQQADSFFAHLPYSSIETTALEIGGTL